MATQGKWNGAQSSKQAQTSEGDDIWKAEDVARYLKIGRSAVYQRAASGEIPSFRLHKTVRFSRKALQEWVAKQVGA